MYNVKYRQMLINCTKIYLLNCKKSSMKQMKHGWEEHLMEELDLVERVGRGVCEVTFNLRNGRQAAVY